MLNLNFDPVGYNLYIFEKRKAFRSKTRNISNFKIFKFLALRSLIEETFVVRNLCLINYRKTFSGGSLIHLRLRIIMLLSVVCPADSMIS